MRDLHRFAVGVVCALAASACDFEHGTTVPDAALPALTVSFDRAATMVDEASGTVTLAVVLSAASTMDVSVDYVVADGTATRPDDYALSDGSVTLLPGQTQAMIPISIAADSLEELDETIVVMLAAVRGASLGATISHTVTIASDILPRVSFMDTSPSSANEATSPQISAVLSLAPQQEVTVELAVAGTAIAGGVDHAAVDGQVITFPANVTSQVVPLDVVQDALDEDDETIELGFKNPSGRLLIATINNTRMHTITDDDPLPVASFAAATSMTAESQSIDLTVSLSAASGRMVTVAYAVTGGTASSADATVIGAPGTVTFMPGETTKAISVSVVNDTLDEANETLAVTLSGPVNATLGADTVHTLTINDDDDPPSVAFAAATASANEVDASVNLTVQLSTASGLDVTVPFTIAGTSTANDPEDYTIGTSPLTIPAGMTSATIVVTTKADTLDEANETVIVDLGTPTNAVAGAITTETLTINDDDPAPTVAFTSMGSTPNEGNTNIVLTVQLSAISGQDVTVPYTIDALSTAVNPADYTISPASPVTIAAGQTSATITIAMKEDTLDEPDETVIVTLDTPTNATLGTPSSYALVIRDDDQPPKVSWNPAESNLTEAEGTSPPGPATRTVTYTVVLTAASGFTITVPIVYSGTATFGTDYSGPLSVSFAPGATSADVVLTIERDAVNEPGPAETIIMGFGMVTNAATQNPLTRTYSIQDDD